SNGIGADAFALVWDGESVHGLNASGRSPALLDAARLRGAAAMPLLGWDSVTVPGAVSAWAALSERFGALPFAALFTDAVRHARDGHPVAPVVAAMWSRAPFTYAGLEDFAEVFLPGGRPPAAGERWASAAHAETLEAIAGTGGEAFYRGELAARTAAAARAAGAALREEDLAAHQPEWVAPLALEALGARLLELPPNGQGIAALIAAGLVDRRGAALDPDSPDGMHVAIEATKLALADAYAHVADPAAMRVAPEALLDAGYLDERAGRIDLAQAGDPGHGEPRRGGTVCLAAADRRGRAVSFIQSNYMGFGSGVVVPGTGIALHNRGAGFVTTPGHPNVVAGGKRPFHTIIPGMVLGPAGPLLSYGLMGGHMQAQGHLQLLLRILAHGQGPQAAADAPRWRVDGGRRVAVEPGIPDSVREALAARGHDVRVEDPVPGFGGAQLVWPLEMPARSWGAAGDWRKDGMPAAR
ncbi:MAG TPA: gamma-glutamyltransferase, partial [Egibacteraceae bacterium]|nr:gamma-glutamyltransferase [Egibacteraceae bacterium]